MGFVHPRSASTEPSGARAGGCTITGTHPGSSPGRGTSLVDGASRPGRGQHHDRPDTSPRIRRRPCSHACSAPLSRAIVGPCRTRDPAA